MPFLAYTNETPFKQLERASRSSAGLDLCLQYDEELIPSERKLCYTGVKVAIPTGYVGLLFIRSGAAVIGLKLANGVGVIDADYRGEIGLLLQNDSGHVRQLKAGQRVAQLVIVPVPEYLDTMQVQSLPPTLRGEGGFGSTGDKAAVLSNN